MQILLYTLGYLTALGSAWSAMYGYFRLAGLLFVVAVILICAILRGRKRLQPAKAQPRSDISGMPSPDEITATLERVRRFLNDERGTGQLPQPQKAITVACSACDVAETYPEGHGNDAAKSPHLLTHPERCMVVGVRQ